MKKLIIAAFITLSIGIIKTEGTGASIRRVKEGSFTPESMTELFAYQNHTYVEDGVFVKPAYAIDLFDELYD